ncbi:MAG: methyl-accepting chemotaxis protein, partial [Thermoanaerobaculia bacterium]
MLSGDQSSPSTFRLGLRPKLVATFALQTIAVALLIIAFEQWRVRAEIRNQTLEHAQSLADTVATASGNAIRTGRTDDLREIITGLRRNPSIEYADFLAPGGTVIVASQPVPPPGMTEMPGRADLTTNGEEQHLFVVPLRAAEGSHASLRLLVNERQASATARSLAWTNFLIALLALAAASALAWIVSRVMIRPILDMVHSASEIARGDLTQRAEIKSGDEMGSLAGAFNTMAGSLEKTVLKLVRSQSQLKTVVETVGSRSRTVIDRVDEQRGVLDDTYQSIDQMNGGVRKITDNVEALSAASEETSSSMLQMVASIEEVSRHTDTLFSSVEETASATQQMATSIREVDHNVDFLSNFATETSSSMVQMSASIAQVEANAARSYELNVVVAEAAESGMRAVRETIDGMEQIRNSVRDSNAVVTRLGERSAAIGRILNVIDDVAEQTNLLALNAAILAAQAGEHGKGFSVVATEIRDLSERTASSTREITGLIRSVQEEVA